MFNMLIVFILIEIIEVRFLLFNSGLRSKGKWWDNDSDFGSLFHFEVAIVR